MPNVPYCIELVDGDKDRLSKCRTTQAQTVDRARILLQKWEFQLIQFVYA